MRRTQRTPSVKLVTDSLFDIWICFIRNFGLGMLKMRVSRISTLNFQTLVTEHCRYFLIFCTKSSPSIIFDQLDSAVLLLFSVSFRMGMRRSMCESQSSEIRTLLVDDVFSFLINMRSTRTTECFVMPCIKCGVAFRSPIRVKTILSKVTKIRSD